MELMISFGVGRIEIETKVKIVKPFSSSISYDFEAWSYQKFRHSDLMATGT